MLQRQTYVAIRQVLLAEANLAPIILILEDLHWVDPTSRELLSYLVQALGDASILLVMVLRDFERQTSLRPLISIIEKNADRVTDIQLRRLSLAEATTLLDQLLRQPSSIHTGLKQRIAHRAEGIPFYIEEIVRMLIDQQAIIQQGEQYKIVPKAEHYFDEIPGTLKSLILTRFDALGEESRQILQRAAVLGRSFPLSLLNLLMTIDVALTASYLNELKDRLFLVDESFDSESGFAFRHALIQEAVYSTLLKRDRRQIHAEVAHVIEAGNLFSGEKRIEMLGYHYAESHEPQRALPFLVKAAQSAHRRGAYENAIYHYSRALALVQEQPVISLDDHSRIGIGLGQTLKLTGEFGEAAQVLEETIRRLRQRERSHAYTIHLISVLTELADVRQREGALTEAASYLEEAQDFWTEIGNTTLPELGYTLADRVAWLYFRQGRLDDAAQLATQVVRELEQQESAAPSLLASLYNTLGGTFYQQGTPAEATPFVQNSLRLYQTLSYSWGTAVAYANLGILYYVQGMWPEAVTCYEQAERIRQENGFVAERAVNLHNLGLLHMAMGDHAQARHDYETSLTISQQIGDNTAIGCCHIWLGHIAFLEAKIEEAKVHVRMAQEMADALGDDHLVQLLLLQVQLHLRANAIYAALELASQALKMSESSGLAEEEVDAYRALGMIYRSTGEYLQAENFLRQALDLSTQREDPYQEGLALLELAHLYRMQARIVNPGQQTRLLVEATERANGACTPVSAPECPV